MFMKTIQLIIIGIFLSIFCSAQTMSQNKKTIITGKISVPPNDTLTVTYYPYKLGNTLIGGTLSKYANPDGSFRLEIENMENPYYFTISSLKKRGKLLEQHLLEPGDSLMIISNKEAIENGGKTNQPPFTITGRNADKNQLMNIFSFARQQFKISGLQVSIVNRYTNLKEPLPLYQKNIKRYKEYWDSLVTAHHFSISDRTKQYLLLDLEIEHITSLLSVYNELEYKYTGKQASASALEQLKKDYKEIAIPWVNQLILNYDFPTLSPYLFSMGLYKLLIDTRIQHGKEKIISGIKYLDALELWPAAWREYIITGFMAALYTNTLSIKDAWGMFPVLDTLVKKPVLRSLIQDFKHLYTRGQSVAPFSVTGKNGETISISDYKDKVVVLDFWFTGCKACVMLGNALKVARKRLADDTDIIFLSVSIDKDKETWLNSVAEEKYTHADFINTYTGGDGMDHPLIKRYDITAYPRLIIIGKNNKLSTANPHIPNSLEEVDLLIQNILDAKK